MQDLSANGVDLRVLAGDGTQIDTTTAAGRLVFGIFAALAEFERELTRERTVDGLKAPRARGRKGGRKFALPKAQVRLAQAAMAHGDTSGVRPVPRARHQDGDALPVRRPAGPVTGPALARSPTPRYSRRDPERSGDLLERRLHAGHDRVVAVAGYVAAPFETLPNASRRFSAFRVVATAGLHSVLAPRAAASASDIGRSRVVW